MSTDIVQNGVAHEEEDEEFHDAEDGFANGEQPTAIAAKMETADVDAADTKEDDRTEDQVPDISGTDNIADQMTVSVDDEIEEIPPVATDGETDEVAEYDAVVVEENAEDELAEMPDPFVNDVEPADEKPEEDVVDIPVAVVEVDAEPAEQPAEGGEESAVEAEADEAVDKSAEPAAEEQAAAEEPAKAEAVEEPPAEVEAEAAEEPPAEVEAEAAEEQVEIEVEAAEVAPAVEEPAGADADAEFQLQEPPTPKRPKTPNELDAPAVEVEVSEDEMPKSPVKGSQPSTPAPAGSVPATPKSSAKSPLANASVLPGTPAPPTPHSAASTGLRTPAASATTAAGEETPKTKTEFVFEEASALTPNSPKKTTFNEDILSTTSSKSKSRSPSKSPPKSSRSGRKVRRSRATKSSEADGEEAACEDAIDAEPAAADSGELTVTEPATDETADAVELSAEDGVAEVVEPAEAEEAAPPVEEEKASEPVVVTADEPAVAADDDEVLVATRSRARIQSPSPPPRVTVRADREPAPRNYTPYDQDSHRETIPPRLPTATSFTSWAAPDRQAYKAISPWVDTSGKYRNEHTVGVLSHTPTYTAIFDDLVNTGPFSHNLYATSRLLERSRSRTRERRSALRSQRSASNYYRFAAQFLPPLRTRDHSTPPTVAVSKTPSQAGSFISFMEYSAAKNYDVARSRGSLYNSNQALSRASSRGNTDYYLGSGRISRVDSYVNNLNSRYEWHVPSNYETYRSASRSRVSCYTPVNEYTSYANPLYEDAQRVRDTGLVRSMYESRIDDLQRNLSKERYERDRLRSRYALVTSQLEQACKQMDLLKTSSYFLQRSGSMPRTSVYGNFYPYY